MMACPTCGGDTTVRETRGARRRRVCKDYTCSGAMQTIEVPLDDMRMIQRLAGAAEGVDE